MKLIRSDGSGHLEAGYEVFHAAYVVAYVRVRHIFMMLDLCVVSAYSFDFLLSVSPCSCPFHYQVKTVSCV